MAISLIIAAKSGVLENVKINLESIQDSEFKEKVNSRLAALNL